MKGEFYFIRNKQNSNMDNLVGKILDSRYEMQELLGVGGMATVYKAYDRVDDRIVSVKILKEEFLDNKEFIKRFKNESQAIAILDHPNIVKIYDVSFGDKMQYITMEYIDGITLKEYIRQQKQVPYKEVVHFISQILNGLDHAHKKGVIHRDIKPQNIMLLSNGTVKITDFGIARLANTETITMADKAIGSVHYIAPEQAKAGVIDERSDIYSVGIMMYEMLTGTLPFDGNSTVAVAIMQLQNEPRPPKEINPNIPTGLVDITMKAIRKNTDQRYQTASEMLLALSQFKQNPNINFNYKYTDENSTTKFIDKTKVFKTSEMSSSSDEIASTTDFSPKKSRVSVVPIITGSAIAFLIVAALLTVFLVVRSFTQTEPVPEIELPNFLGQKYEDVLEQYGDQLQFEVEYETDLTKEVGEIIKQSPTGDGKNVKVNSIVYLNVIAKSDSVVMPDVKGYTADKAITKIKAENLKPIVKEVYDDDTAIGLVIGTNPAGNSMVEAESEVTIFVSKGAEKIDFIVGEYTNRDYESAKELIIKDGFKVGEPEYQESEMPKDYVIGQKPAIGTTANSGDAIVLVLSNGIAPPPQTTQITIDVPLPKTNKGDLVLQIDIYNQNGEKTNSVTKTVNPKITSSYSMTLSGNETASTAIVKLKNDISGTSFQQYITYSIDFTQKTFKITHEDGFVDKSIEVVSSQPPAQSQPPVPISSQPPVESNNVSSQEVVAPVESNNVSSQEVVAPVESVETPATDVVQ